MVGDVPGRVLCLMRGALPSLGGVVGWVVTMLRVLLELLLLVLALPHQVCLRHVLPGLRVDGSVVRIGMMWVMVGASRVGCCRVRSTSCIVRGVGWHRIFSVYMQCWRGIDRHATNKSKRNQHD
mmetsp:Transcript_60199/g.141754  ORF Transcript_60199/g.141754 Transcript_60199/m.141754 type:complete len:124 (-) Transcript_60199:159-530(-)